MKQAISGVTDPETTEVTVMIVWPTIAATSLGRSLGRLYAIRSGFGRTVTFGRIFVLLSIPVALGLFFFMLLPGIGRRYRLTNRRMLIEHALSGKAISWVALEDFDGIRIEVLPGQEWHAAGEMIFLKGQVESFRLHGVSRPESFRQTCLKVRQAYVAVKKIREHEAAATA
ncbi:MAG: PH domain-containing protein [Pirellulales bacterium]|nr:PH domain-containing protein [Pirellulales bacterium]